MGLEVSTAALAIVYFEKLVFKGLVSKSNRKLVMSVCLVLAFKFNEANQEKETLKFLLDDIERVQSLSPKQVLQSEIYIFCHLLFGLKPADRDVLSHFHRLLKAIDQTPSNYLGEKQAEFYFESIDLED